MVEKTFEDLLDKAKEHALSEADARHLIRGIRNRSPLGGVSFLQMLCYLALLVAAPFALFDLVPAFVGWGTGWMLVSSVLLALAVLLVFALSNPRPVLWDRLTLGMWLWGGAMLLIAFNFGAVVLIASQCIDPGLPTAGEGASLFLSGGRCAQHDVEPILRFFLAAREFGTLIGVTLGFASIAWVNFFSSRFGGRG